MPRGRKPEFITSKETRRRILAAIRNGHTLKTAAEYANIAPETLSRWLTRKGEDYDQLRQEIRKAQADCKFRHVNRIEQAAKDGRWQASAWLLERRFFEEFGSKQAIEHSGETVTTQRTEHVVDVQNLMKNLTDDEKKQLREILKIAHGRTGKSAANSA